MRWLSFARASYRPALEQAVLARYPRSVFVWMESPEEMREALLQEMPGQVGALVGPVKGNAAPINLAAAIVHDAHARMVVLAQPAPSGSLRSRAHRAGISEVIALEEQTKAAGPIRAYPQGEGSSARKAEGPAAGRGRSSEGRADPADDLDEVEPEAGCGRQEKVPTKQGGGAAQPRLKIARPAIDGRIPRIDSRPQQHGPNPCPVLCIASGRGGVGKSALSCLMAVVGARWGLRVGLLDLDLACGNDYAYFGLTGPAALDAMGDAGSVDPRLIASCGKVAQEGVSLWGPCARPENAELVGPLAGNLLDRVASQSDLVIVDAATAWTDAVAQAAQVADRLLLVCPEYGGQASSLSRVGGLAVRLGVARTRIVRIINLCNPKKDGESFINRADVGLEAARTIRILDGGVEADELIMEGHVADLATQDSELSRSVASCLAQILQELGRLPDCNEARRALEQHGHAGHRGIFGHRKEAM